MLQLVLRVVTVALMLLCATSVDHCGVDAEHSQLTSGAASMQQDAATAIALLDSSHPSCSLAEHPAHRCEMASKLPDLDGLNPQLSPDLLTPPPGLRLSAGAPACAPPAGAASVLSRICVCRT
ncbi:hypothetical protein ACWT_0222 [Actinoplanes sp. SE50]|uniref:hypothetical protein n=1 Tax=Actinoplanes sp. SE50 TaxID=2033844 RepID=UPI000C059310|nr:hypothetical protein [Actinoplanes sp. SE50]ATO79637.1 hypothetical protein ACWT_0222 [Actinoplanes sp. SE50]